MNPTKVRVFEDIYSQRAEDAGWNVIQAMTLLKVAQEKKHLRSFVIYAAFEMRHAVEQQMFTIIRMVSKKGNVDDLLKQCRKKDGLFKQLAIAKPNYTNLCYLMATIALEFSKFPPVANWDIKILRQHWSALSDYCHSPFISGVSLDEAWYKKALSVVLDAHNYFFSIMSASKGTGVLPFSNAKPPYRKICEDFLAKRISRAELRPALRKLKESAL